MCTGLGTDGCSSNNNLDLFTEMDMAAKLHKASRLDPTVMDAATVLRMATIAGGARDLDMEGNTLAVLASDGVIRTYDLANLYRPEPPVARNPKAMSPTSTCAPTGIASPASTSGGWLPLA